jgi:carboxylate-amine ligase
MPLEFTQSPALTLGVELELMVLGTRDYDLTRGAPDLLARLAKAKLDGAVKPEITESMIEINSGVHTRHAALLEELTRTRDAIGAEARRLNLAVAGGGAHPFHRWSERRIYPTERFLRVSALYGYLAKQFTVFGQHIHIGVASGDDAIYLTHRLARYIPHFIALSAASPFAQGEDTSFETSRLHAVSSFPLAGHLPPVDSWQAFNGYFDAMAGYGIVESISPPTCSPTGAPSRSSPSTSCTATTASRPAASASRRCSPMRMRTRTSACARTSSPRSTASSASGPSWKRPRRWRRSASGPRAR